ncbi:uncharacterized protein BDR25DRAFT_341634 [Lindgomyces ingoldianus]|uniref:Uncharacterized protein n=1 Tax=Lindgomyces ingoldianus TaxID=673940 RepID=A0ACB6R0K3_9PLEO|nr:uncharacterized protein BDR25DRAFT_341634 [Lindgomyces ingoldianus]KAF2472803.1 hypothetical protein BDR25DRAFT_341634 [Lindgomyces ingoldianus]
MGNLTSPLYLLGPPLLLLVSIPLALLATVTTTIAISTLAVRVSIVYFELGVALFHSYLFPPPVKTVPKPPSPRRISPHRSRNRRSSVTSTTSSQDTTVPQTHGPRLHNKSGSFASLIGTSSPTRDFEGVGGWRVPGDDDEEALWMGMNSRLELPAVMPKRKHQRSLTGGSQRWSWSPEAMRMSPMQSRARTPGDERPLGDEYFPLQPNTKPFSTASDPVGRSDYDGGRKSMGDSSSSSAGSSSRRPSMAMKQAGD